MHKLVPGKLYRITEQGDGFFFVSAETGERICPVKPGMILMYVDKPDRDHRFLLPMESRSKPEKVCIREDLIKRILEEAG